MKSSQQVLYNIEILPEKYFWVKHEGEYSELKNISAFSNTNESSTYCIPEKSPRIGYKIAMASFGDENALATGE